MTHTLYHGDCLDILPTLPAQSVDAIIADPPYGTTACKWDSVIPLDAMWRELKRVVKPRGAVVLFAAQPFTTTLIASDLERFKYTLVWRKTVAANFFNAKNKPLCLHEDICIFSDGTTANRSERRMTYNPQGLVKADIVWKRPRKYPTEHNFTRPSHALERIIEFSGYPGSVLEYANGNNGNLHPTQKPVELLRYLVRTYTNAGETVLDFTMGSGTCGVACVMEGRNFIGVELDAGYFDIAKRRIEQVQPALMEAAD